VGPDGTVFLANGDDGLRAYTYDGNSFINTAHIDDGSWAHGVAVGQDGMIFLANGTEGLIAYMYSGYTAIANEFSRTPDRYGLLQNYPNPFNPSTKIEYTLPKSEYVNITVYNTLGQAIKTLVNEHMPIGHHQVEFNAQNLPSGVYFYLLEAGEYVQTRKMLLVK
jgi:hypothetical protein